MLNVIGGVVSYLTKCEVCQTRYKLDGLYGCIRCYVSRNAKRLKISHYVWFKAHRAKFEELLKARYFAIIYGLDYPKERSRFYLVWDNNDTSKYRYVPRTSEIKHLRKIDKIIINLERQARRYLERINRESQNQ